MTKNKEPEVFTGYRANRRFGSVTRVKVFAREEDARAAAVATKAAPELRYYWVRGDMRIVKVITTEPRGYRGNLRHTDPDTGMSWINGRSYESYAECHKAAVDFYKLERVNGIAKVNAANLALKKLSTPNPRRGIK